MTTPPEDILHGPLDGYVAQSDLEHTSIACIGEHPAPMDVTEDNQRPGNGDAEGEAPVGDESSPQKADLNGDGHEAQELVQLQENVIEVEDQDEEEEEGQEHSRPMAISRFENLVLSFLSQLARAISLSSVPTENGKGVSTQTRKVVLELASRLKESKDDDPATRCIQFPRASHSTGAMHTRQFAHIFKVMDVAHEALVNDVPVTKRDIYYRDVQLFRKQSVVDKLVDDLASTFSMSRANLNIRAALKGVFCGSGITIHLVSGAVVYGSDSEPSLVPQGEEIAHIELDDSVLWVLVVEKEAVFQTLCSLGLANHPALLGPGIIITGKGYPDRATRQLVKTLGDNLPKRIPIVAIVDADAYGIDIVSVYKYGSRSMKHERRALAADRVEWIGVQSDDLEKMGVDRDALLPITIHDHRKALAMLRSNPSMPHEWKVELMNMLHNRRKAEIEVISSLPLQTLTTGGQVFQGTDNVTSYQESEQFYSVNPLARYLILKINDAMRSLSSR